MKTVILYGALVTIVLCLPKKDIHMKILEKEDEHDNQLEEKLRSITIEKKHADVFLKRTNSRGLWEECREGCSYEEVREVIEPPIQYSSSDLSDYANRRKRGKDTKGRIVKSVERKANDDLRNM
ncbi:Hypothetical predicted protein [Mytilus galloprovincialis]|uniref:Uncharacterized protein n=1 Tax=Mytilus galloprovincialis TaxID=29158 RepID=A0A8B6FKH1_MYTGA|nr:Hypothetical predicted protein [Mytilus galloprovincialis]